MESMSDKINIGIVDTKTSNIQSVIYACKKQNFNSDKLIKGKKVKLLDFERTFHQKPY